MFVAWLPQRLSGSEKMVSKLVGELSSVWLAQRFTAVDRRGGRYVKKSLRNRAPEVGIQVRPNHSWHAKTADMISHNDFKWNPKPTHPQV